MLQTLKQIDAHAIQDQVVRLLGTDYQLAGIISLEALGMTTFPVNDTRKIIKSQIKEAVMRYIDGK